MEVIRKKDNKVMPIYTDSAGNQFLKLKTDSGSFVKRALNAVIALALPASVPPGFVEVPRYRGTFVSRDGEVWSGPTHKYPLGTYLKISNVDGGYTSVSTTAYGRVELHKLLALTFLDSQYLDKGLCVMHLDDNKHNFSLDNLKIGTYSENIKAAYANGLNPGNGLKR